MFMIFLALIITCQAVYGIFQLARRRLNSKDIQGKRKGKRKNPLKIILGEMENERI